LGAEEDKDELTMEQGGGDTCADTPGAGGWASVAKQEIQSVLAKGGTNLPLLWRRRRSIRSSEDFATSWWRSEATDYGMGWFSIKVRTHKDAERKEKKRQRTLFGAFFFADEAELEEGRYVWEMPC
jgi:hypothetical protein